MPNCGGEYMAVSIPCRQASACQPSTNIGASDCSSPDAKNLGPRQNRKVIREQIRDFILHMLGAPRVSIELTEQNLDFCIDQALELVEYYAPREYFQYYVFTTVPGKSVYRLPDEIGYVRRVSYMEQGSYSYMTSDVGGVVPMDYFYQGGGFSSFLGGQVDPITPIWGRMGEWTLYKQYEQMFSRLSSRLGGWEWLEDYHTLKLYPVPCGPIRVNVHYIQRCKDWSRVHMSMKEGALVFAKFILGRVRSKIKNPPGAGGGLQLDGVELLAEAKDDKKQWLEDLQTRWGDVLPIVLG